VGTRSAGELFVLSHASPNARLTAIRERFEKHAESLSVSVMTAAELRFGRAGRGVFGTTCDSRLDQRSYGPLCADSPIGNMDLLIASHAVSQRMVLVTNNLKQFANVPGLTVEVWS
jgi:tRNA(fMet)-specific endonuclease VapC